MLEVVCCLRRSGDRRPLAQLAADNSCSWPGPGTRDQGPAGARDQGPVDHYDPCWETILKRMPNWMSQIEVRERT